MPRTVLTPCATASGAPAAEGVWLHDGTPVRLRPIRRSDLELERRFVNSLSSRTRYLRLLSGRALLPGELERWTDIDPAREIAWIAVIGVGATEQELGVARCIRDDAQPGAWDFAVVIGDAWQHQGLGDALLRQLMVSAAQAGIERLSSVTLSENQAMLALGRRLGFSGRREPGDATLTRIGKRLTV